MLTPTSPALVATRKTVPGVASTPGGAVLFGKETLKNGISGDEFIALLAAHGAGERGDVAFLFEFVFDFCGSFHRTDENKDSSVAVFFVPSEFEDFVANGAIVCLVYDITERGHFIITSQDGTEYNEQTINQVGTVATGDLQTNLANADCQSQRGKGKGG